MTVYVINDRDSMWDSKDFSFRLLVQTGCRPHMASYLVTAVHIPRENPCGDGCSGAVQGECLLPGGREGCSWWEIRHARGLHCYKQTENIKQLRVACSECIFIVYCECSDNILD
jgi:hypothetical protein